VGHQYVGGLDDLGPVGVDAVEGAGAGEAFQRPLVDLARIDALEEVEQVAERPALGPHLDHMLHGLQADVAHRAQGVEHGSPSSTSKSALERLMSGAPDLDLELAGVLVEHRQLVGVAQVEAHRGGEELDRRVGLQPGRSDRRSARRRRRATC
jgi:hypothetical protein